MSISISSAFYLFIIYNVRFNEKGGEYDLHIFNHDSFILTSTSLPTPLVMELLINIYLLNIYFSFSLSLFLVVKINYQNLFFYQTCICII